MEDRSEILVVIAHPDDEVFAGRFWQTFKEIL